MEDYPRTLMALERRFGTDEACREYLAALRWPRGFFCPSCGHKKAWRMSRGLWLCACCRRQVSVTAGTIFQDTRLPLTVWFRAMWHVTGQKTGASALGVQRVLGLGSYQTAWAWLHKLRRAMVRPGRDRLAGMVEVDETYWGANEPGVVGRQTEAKALVIVAAECKGPRKVGRIRMAHIGDLKRRTLHGFIAENVAPGSVVVTDGLRAYGKLTGYDHRPVLVGGGGRLAVELPHVHTAVSLAKRWLMGTHQGAISHKHLGYYLDEFTFRFNRRSSASRGKLFYRLVQQAVQIEPHPYRTLIDHNP